MNNQHLERYKMNHKKTMTTFIKVLECHQSLSKTEMDEALKKINQMQMDKAYQTARLASSAHRRPLHDDLCEVR